jgi:hypothetical protein
LLSLSSNIRNLSWQNYERKCGLHAIRFVLQ